MTQAKTMVILSSHVSYYIALTDSNTWVYFLVYTNDTNNSLKILYSYKAKPH